MTQSANELHQHIACMQKTKVKRGIFSAKKVLIMPQLNRYSTFFECLLLKYCIVLSYMHDERDEDELLMASKVLNIYFPFSVHCYRF